MDLRDSLNRYYYDSTVSDLRQLSRTGGGELSYNSIMYLDVISYQHEQGGVPSAPWPTPCISPGPPPPSRSTTCSSWAW